MQIVLQREQAPKGGPTIDLLLQMREDSLGDTPFFIVLETELQDLGGRTSVSLALSCPPSCYVLTRPSFYV